MWESYNIAINASGSNVIARIKQNWINLQDHIKNWKFPESEFSI